MSTKAPLDIAAQVAARVEQEKALLESSKSSTTSNAEELNRDFILYCLRANRVGDPPLIFRVTTVFDPDLIILASAHWKSDQSLGGSSAY